MRGFPKLIPAFLFVFPSLVGMKHIEYPLEIAQSIRAHKNPSLETIKASIQDAIHKKRYKNLGSLLIIAEHLKKKRKEAYKKVLHEEDEFDRNPFLGGAFTTEQDHRDLRAPVEEAERRYENVCDVHKDLKLFIWAYVEHEKEIKKKRGARKKVDFHLI